MKKCIYRNGSYTVTVDKFGTKEYSGEIFNPDHPDSLDIKITDKCEYACSFCHESSGKTGQHGDLKGVLDCLTGLPKGVEIAIGGGNPLLHPDLEDFLKALKDHFFVALTVNFKDIEDPEKNTLLKKLIKNKLITSLGVSLADRKIDFDKILGYESLKEKDSPYTILCNSAGCKVVYHAIIGITPLKTIKSLAQFSISNSAALLVLGFKSFGRAKDKRIPDGVLGDWKDNITKIVAKLSSYKFGRLTVAFDNLALEQLDVKSLIPNSIWDEHYMGSEFSHSMYIDTVRREYGPTSRSDFSERKSWDSSGTVIEYFRKNHNDHDKD